MERESSYLKFQKLKLKKSISEKKADPQIVQFHNQAL